MRVVLAHGWGFGPDLWDAVASFLVGYDICRLDNGYFGGRRIGSPKEAHILVGHSAGVMEALLTPASGRRGLLSINGFPRFTQAATYEYGTPMRVLTRMQAAFVRDPDAVLRDFRARCGVTGDWSGAPDARRLGDGLAELATGDGRAGLEACPVVALAGRQDTIVPPTLTDAAFARHHVDWISDGGHMLPLTHPQACAESIRAFHARACATI
ncbi:hypothetical protein AA103196_2014 [Ameyamaea chiangmaiensis NBRC 103196]|uniref:Alpha/beta fold hydrolase n=1 Tax=Ameyamaea chiangmaiensis TaxID=442969 RepID=A0A850P774_9PROT|nr:alpha/beta hydrolase [Ameyamaea chiangmaiensis]MBS4073720.1 alpha/beta fold hydrolase [Ameyamaea chiangmaiensis]NVN39788.1 alpha/beta fold hydrolase [Ameyamaea chiangmaiensis]GBQ68700.1 hypothetical protein AA103196_2014 [Ameyamaea chiangmaiensis NBRC 103196]